MARRRAKQLESGDDLLTPEQAAHRYRAAASAIYAAAATRDVEATIKRRRVLIRRVEFERWHFARLHGAAVLADR